jgi:hypothetical protein
MPDEESLKNLIYSLDADDEPKAIKRRGRGKEIDGAASKAVEHKMLDLSPLNNLADPSDSRRILPKVSDLLRGIRETPTASAWCAIMMPDMHAALARLAGQGNQGKKKKTRSKVIKSRDSIKEVADYLLQTGIKPRNLVSKILEKRPAFTKSQVYRRLKELGYLTHNKK